MNAIKKENVKMTEYEKLQLRRHLLRAARQQEERAAKANDETTAFHAREAAKDAQDAARRLTK